MGDRDITSPPLPVRGAEKFNPKVHKLRSALEKAIDISSEDPETLYQLQERLGKGSYGMVYKGKKIEFLL